VSKRSGSFNKSLFTLCVIAVVGLPLIARTQSAHVQIQINQLPQAVIEARLHKISPSNVEREKTLQALFIEAGCRDTNLVEQPVKHQKVPNIICTLPGTTDSEIIVAGHTDHVSLGVGAIDNWSSAALLPSFFQALNNEPRKHTFVFIGFTNEESGLFGSQFYVSQLTQDQISKIRAMINLDCVGVGTTDIWLTHSTKALADSIYNISLAMKLPLGVVNVDQVGDDDSSSFRKRNVPTLMVHSLTQDTFSLIHSDADQVSAMNMKNYFDTYRLVSTYLAYLDSTQN
jgi:Iap family predicted aminopeptidase